MKRFPYIYQLIIFFCCVSQLEAAPANQGANSTSEAAIIEKAAAIEMKQLVKKVEKKGRVQILVEFKETLDTNDYVQFKQKQDGEQPSLIEFQQKRLMKEIPVKYTDSIKTYENLPYIAMSVTKEELNNLRRSKRVKDIYEDRAYRPAADGDPIVFLSDYLETDQAWSSGYTGKGQSIVVIDSGVARQNPSLRGRVVREACISSRIEDKPSGIQVITPTCRGGHTNITGKGAANVDCRVGDISCAHGTYVALLAAGNNGAANFVGSGMAPEAKIIPIKAISNFNVDTDCAPEPAPCLRFVTSDLAKALDYVLRIHRKAKVAAVNMSLGGPGDCFRNPLRRAIRLLRKAKVATVVASGNDGTPYTISDPACIPEAIAVGSTKITADSTNKTTTTAISEFSNGARTLELLAPGEDLTVPNFRVDPAQSQKISGTSFAAPLVAGAWASLKAHKPKATVEEILQALQATGVPVLDVRNATIKPEIRVDRAHSVLTP